MSTPLYKKLGLKKEKKNCLINAPAAYSNWLEQETEYFSFVELPEQHLDFVHIFSTDELDLIVQLQTIIPLLNKDGMIWVSWPKKTSSIDTSIDKWDVMRIGQESGLVDVKVCSVSDDWSAHKFVIRLKDR